MLQSLPPKHQTLLFSATMPKEIEALTAQYMRQPVKVKIGRVSVPTANVAQTLERCAEGTKLELLLAMLWQHGGRLLLLPGASPARCCLRGRPGPLLLRNSRGRLGLQQDRVLQAIAGRRSVVVC